MKNFFNLLFFAIFFTVFTACQQTNMENISFEEFIKEIKNSHSTQREEIVNKYLSNIGTTPIIEGKDKVHFIWFGEADSVKIQGDLQRGWSTPEKLITIDCGDFDFFYISYILPSDAQIEYQFLVNDEIALDMSNPNVEKNFEYGDRNLLQMPYFESSEVSSYRKEVNKGRIESRIFKSKNVEFSDRKLAFYLPTGYNKNNSYPVLLVNDGNIKLYTTPFKNIVDNLIYEKKIEPIIIVFVPCMERDKEYCFQDFAYSQIIAKEMVPFIKKNYSTAQTADKWGIMGSSKGGSISMVTGFLYSDIIANVGAQGGAGGGILICNANSALTNYLKKKERYPLRNIFASVGTYDLEFPNRGIVLLDNARIFHEKLDSLEIEHVYKEFNDGHRDSNWNESIDDILIQFFGI